MLRSYSGYKLDRRDRTSSTISLGSGQVHQTYCQFNGKRNFLLICTLFGTSAIIPPVGGYPKQRNHLKMKHQRHSPPSRKLFSSLQLREKEIMVKNSNLEYNVIITIIKHQDYIWNVFGYSLSIDSNRDSVRFSNSIPIRNIWTARSWDIPRILQIPKLLRLGVHSELAEARISLHRNFHRRKHPGS